KPGPLGYHDASRRDTSQPNAKGLTANSFVSRCCLTDSPYFDSQHALIARRVVGSNDGVCVRLVGHSSVAGIPAAGQVFDCGFLTTSAACGYSEVDLEVRYRCSALRDRGLHLAFGDRITDTNKHENDYHPSCERAQAFICISSAKKIRARDRSRTSRRVAPERATTTPVQNQRALIPA